MSASTRPKALSAQGGPWLNLKLKVGHVIICFFNVINISAFNAMIVWVLRNPEWKLGHFRWHWLTKQLARSLVASRITTRTSKPCAVRSSVACNLDCQISHCCETEEGRGAYGITRLSGIARTEKRYTDVAHAATCLSHCSSAAEYTCDWCKLVHDQHALITCSQLLCVLWF